MGRYSLPPLVSLLSNFRMMSSTLQHHPAQYCIDLVRTQDHEHYLASLLLPSEFRSHAFAIRALSCEVARVRDSVTDRTLARIRTQFWLDLVSGIYSGNVPQHPVALQLARMVEQHRPSQELLEQLSGSRQQFASDQPFDSVE